jgi:hypothetical protein
VRTEGWQSNMRGLRLVGEEESGSVSTTFGPVRAGLTTTHRTQQGSSAFGIAQMLGERSREPELQILRGLRYISERYGTPCKAYRYHQRKGHY